ncbi:MAG: alpha-2-macroglobulin family protein, partial [Anaerolineales bacterium]
TAGLGASARGASGSPLAGLLGFSFTTVPLPAVRSSSPAAGAAQSPYQGVELVFNAPMDATSLARAISFKPELEGLRTYWRSEDLTLSVFGNFQPATDYVLTVDTQAADPYGAKLSAPFSLSFATGDYPPRLDFTRFQEAITVSSFRRPQTELQVLNLRRLDLALYRLAQSELFALEAAPWLLYDGPAPLGELVRQWSVTVPASPNRNQTFPATLQDDPLPPGAYLFFVDSPEDSSPRQARILISRSVELVLKSYAGGAMVWAVDLGSGEPVPDRLVRLVDETGAEFASAETDDQGIAQLIFPPLSDPYSRVFALTGAAGEAEFALTGSGWTTGINPYEFQIGYNPAPSDRRAYLYTDRPIYRPGHMVRVRGVLRRIQDGQFVLPDQSTIALNVRDPNGANVFSDEVAVSGFGTFHAEFALGEEAPLGVYGVDAEVDSVWFTVSAYRKPEFTVTVAPSRADVLIGETLTAQIRAEYYFGGPVAGAEISWSAWTDAAAAPGMAGAIDWYGNVAGPPAFDFPPPLGQGSAQTEADGTLTLRIPTSSASRRTQRVTIEATLMDSAGLPVTGRADVLLHPASVYLGLTPERFSLGTGETAVVHLHSTDVRGRTVPGQDAELFVERITWRQVVDERGDLAWEPEAELLNRGPATTEADGTARFSFVPLRPGNYRVRAEARDPAGRRTRAEATLWVAGPASGIWREPAAGRMALVPDRAVYRPGETARILVPSPFAAPVPALVTVERERMLTHRVLHLSPGDMIDVPLEGPYAPNVFVSVVLAAPGDGETAPALAAGLVELAVSAEAERLQVRITPDRSQAAPGDAVTYRLQVSDAEGRPVQAEFSLALADLAALSLVGPNSGPPFETFYASRPLSVGTAASLVQSGEQGGPGPPPDGRGGGGGDGEATAVRREFPDTAYWNPSVVTDARGQASVNVTLPDSLTTWRMDARGVTTDTRLGGAVVDLIASKPLLIRPSTPRFFTAGDRAVVAAVVHNNTGQDLSVDVQLTTGGAEITRPAESPVMVPDGDSRRVEWEIRVGDEDRVELTFAAAGGGFLDASGPTVGSAVDGGLPVLRYSAAGTAGTSGGLADAGARTEVISLPRRYDATQGELRVGLDVSPAAALASALRSLEHEALQSSELIVSRFLPTLAAYRALQTSRSDDPELRDRLESAMRQGVQSLRARQLGDGGWSWSDAGPGDAYLTAYVMHGLSQARQSGAEVSSESLDAAAQFLRAGLTPLRLLTTQPDRDRQAFVLYALAGAGSGDLALTRQHALEHLSGTAPLSRWASAVLTLGLEILSPGDELLTRLAADLESAAVLSASGAHWEETQLDAWNLSSSVRTTAHALQVLAALRPDDPIGADAARWLLAARDRNGGWASSHETAWAVLGLSDWLEASGSLAPEYDYLVQLNGRTIGEGRATPAAPLASLEIVTPIADLIPDRPNQVTIGREQGPGSLYYTAHLTVYRPVEDVAASAQGLAVSRQIFRFDGTCGGMENPCPGVDRAAAGEDLLVRVTLVVPTDQYYVVLEDPFPAGAEPMDPELRTSPQGGPPLDVTESELLRGGWGWLNFSRAEIRDNRIRLFADFLPAGTYQYQY